MHYTPPIFRQIQLILFVLTLLFAQQGASLHTLRHVFAEQTQQQNKQLPHTDDCEQCFTYAQLGSALNNGFLSFDFRTSLAHVFVANHLNLISRFSLTARARGPPSLQSSN
jgi:hypothetical protein